MADGKVIYDITGDNSGFQKSVNETENIAQTGANKITDIAGGAAKIRSKTFVGIAEAFAEQWG